MPTDIEEEGFEALHRLYELARGDSGQCRVVACFLLGLYNGFRFPFNLTELRGLDRAIQDDCFAVLRMDSRVTRKEVHLYFEDGSRKFEDLVRAWNITDMQKLRTTGDGTPSPAPKRGYLRDDAYTRVTYVSVSTAPGYRDVTLNLEVDEMDEGKVVSSTRLAASMNPEQGMTVLRGIVDIHRHAWDRGRPIDAGEEESRPNWLNRLQAAT